ncbi:hypothetical protein M405DRAFT_923566 [Rhizopogon salebrosus TDB-379]|nr:hypothetical protein M405DRAFT_923566 [Rhizopogon salebrosus TDB-379]
MTTTADGGNEMDPWEEERSWRDPSAHRLCGAAVTWLDRHQQRKIIISLRLVADLASHQPLYTGTKLSDRFDPRSSSLSDNAYLWRKNITAS